MAGLLDILNRNPGLLSPLPRQSALGPGIGQAQSLLSQPMPVAAPVAPQRAGVNPARVFSRFLFGGEDPFSAYDAEKVRPAMQARAAEKLAFERSAQQNLLGMFGGGPAATPGIMQTPETPGFTGAPMAGAPTMGGGLPSIRQAGPVLAAAQLAGIEGVSGLRELITAGQPSIQVGPDGTTYDSKDPGALNRRFGKNENINGFIRNMNDPENVNSYSADIAEGQEPVYDQGGRMVGVRNINGSVESDAARVRAVNDAQNASEASYAGGIAGAKASAEAPYRVVQVTGPDGSPMTIAVSQIAGGGITGQSPADAIRAEGVATGDVARSNARADQVQTDNGNIPVLRQALELLPDVITGFGAPVALTTARALAATGDADAQRRVAATETFQSTTGRAVLAVAKQLGSGSGITNADREFAGKVAGGEITLNRGTIERIMRLEQQAIARRLMASNTVNGVVNVSGPDQASVLPRGTRFRGPDGREREVQ